MSAKVYKIVSMTASRLFTGPIRFLMVSMITRIEYS